MGRSDVMPLLGVGLYTPGEAALYVGAGASTQQVLRWIHGSKKGGPVVKAQLPDDPYRTITFLDLIQAMAIRAIRHQYNIPLPKLEEAATYARKKYGIDYPFATKHTTYVYRLPYVPSPIDKLAGKKRQDKTGLLINPPGETPNDAQLVELTGARRDQMVISQVFEPVMQDVVFDPKLNNIAVKLTVMRGRDRSVFLDPQQHFGQPMTESGYAVQTLYDAYLAEGGVRDAAAVYEVQPEDIELAVKYHVSLPTTSRAA